MLSLYQQQQKKSSVLFLRFVQIEASDFVRLSQIANKCFKT